METIKNGPGTVTFHDKPFYAAGFKKNNSAINFDKM